MIVSLPILPPQPCYPGSWVLFGKDPWRVISCSESGKTRIERVGQLCIEVDSKHLRSVKASRLHVDRLKAFEDYPQEKRKIALDRLAAVKNGLEKGWSRENLLPEATKLDVSLQTIIRWTDWYICSGYRVEVLIPEVFRYGVAHNILPAPVEEIIREGIVTIWLVEERPPLQRLVDWITTTCVTRGFDPPSRSLIKRRADTNPKSETTLHREGVKAARDKHGPLPGRAPTGGRPLGKIEIDHTITNLFARLPSGRVVRLWITMAIDLFTRMVVGLYLSLDRPSRVAVGLCLYRVMTSRIEWLRSHGIVAPWPCIGVPRLVGTDSGKDFESHDYTDWALRFGFKVQKRKRKRPEGGGHIENLMGKAAMALELFPGKTFRSVFEKGAYDAKANAVMTIDEVEQALLHFFIEIYHEHPHRGLRNRAPIGIWEEWQKENAGGLPEVQELVQPGNDLLMSLLPSFEATIQQSGVTRKKVEYFDYEVVQYAGEKNPDSESGKWRFHFHPRYSKYIHWKNPRTGRWISITSKDRAMPNMSEDERIDLEYFDTIKAKTSIRWDRIHKGRLALYELLKVARARLVENIASAKRDKGKKAPLRISKPTLKDTEVLDLASNKALLKPLIPDPPSTPDKPVGQQIIPTYEIGTL